MAPECLPKAWAAQQWGQPFVKSQARSIAMLPLEVPIVKSWLSHPLLVHPQVACGMISQYDKVGCLCSSDNHSSSNHSSSKQPCFRPRFTPAGARPLVLVHPLHPHPMGSCTLSHRPFTPVG